MATTEVAGDWILPHFQGPPAPGEAFFVRPTHSETPMHESRLTSLLFGAALAVVAIWMGQPAVTAERADEAAVMFDTRQAAAPASIVGCDGDPSADACTAAATEALGVSAAIEQSLDVAEAFAHPVEATL